MPLKPPRLSRCRVKPLRDCHRRRDLIAQRKQVLGIDDLLSAPDLPSPSLALGSRTGT
jgi:hypothetical protein